jgi:3-dehydroquinate dehydratase / shikimate dehydrogenase
MILKTERLILRPWCEEDFAPFAALNADSRVREYFSGLLSQKESDESAQTKMDFIHKHGWGFWAVSVPNVADFIGFVGLEPVNFTAHFTPAVEIGWRLAYGFWNKGYATEGARAALQYGFETLQLEEIVSFTAIANQRSRKVMGKIGMHHDSKDDFDYEQVPLDHPVRRQALYRLQRREWQQKNIETNQGCF